MVALKINLADVGGRPVSATRAVFLSAPAHRPSVTVDGLVVTTTPYPVDVVAGLATVTVEPGELVVEIRSGLADSTPKRVTVPSGVEAVTLQELLESAYVYDPPVVSLVKQYLDDTKKARDIAVAAADGVSGIADDVAQIAEDRAAAELARDEAKESEIASSESRAASGIAAKAAGDSATSADESEVESAGHARRASDSAAAAALSEEAAGRHKVGAETAAELAVQTAAGIGDVAADAAQVKIDRDAVESAAAAVAADRETVTDARDVVVESKRDVEQIKTDVVQAKDSIENTANLVDQTLAQYGAQFVAERELSQKAVTDATSQAQRAEDAADGIIAGAVLPGSVTRESLSVVLQQLVDLADTAVQPEELADAIAGIVDEAPGAMATLRALAEALGNDPNFATTVLTMIGEKANADEVVKLVGAQSVNGAKDFIGGLRSNGKEVVVTDDARLSDSRTPKPHSHDIDVADVQGLGDALQGIQQAFGGLLSDVAADLQQKIDEKGTSNLTLGTTGVTAMAGNKLQVVTALPTSGRIVGAWYGIPE